MSDVLPDPSTPYGERVAQRLRDEKVVWLTTTSADGTPVPNPVWFIWDGESFLIYSRDDALRNKHIPRNAHVALNFNADPVGDDVVIFTGEATLAPDEPSCDQVPAYVAKYGERMVSISGTAAEFAAKYCVAIRVRPAKVRGF